MISFFYFHDNWFIGDENYRNLNNLFQKLLFTQNVQISIIFLSVKSIVIRIKKWYHVSLTSNISAKTWSNCTSRGCFEIFRTSRFQNWPWFWKSSKIWGSNRQKQNTTNLWSQLYIYHFREGRKGRLSWLWSWFCGGVW